MTRQAIRRRSTPAVVIAACAGAALAGQPRFEPVPPPDGLSCAYNEVRVAPDGRQAALWLDRRTALLSPYGRYRQSRFALVNGDAPVRHYRVDGEVSALHWTGTPGELEMLIDGRSWVRIDASTMRLAAAPVDGRWFHVNVRNDRWNGVRMLFGAPATAQWLNEGLRSIRLAQTAIASEAPAFVHVDPSTLKVESNADGVGRQLPFELSYLSTGPDGRIDMAAPGARLVRDPAGGLPSGILTPDAIAYRTPDGTTVVGKPRTGLFTDAEQVRGRWSLLGADADGAHWLEQGGEGSARLQVCGGDTRGSGPPTAAVTSAGPALSRLTMHRQVEEAANAPLVMRFHGGPFALATDEYPAPSLRRLVRSGYSVVEPDYPGSRGIAVGRTPRLDAASVSAANDALVSWARRQGYRRWLVVGESLGALPALDLASRYGRETAGLLLLAPLGRLDADRDIGGRPLGANPMQTLVEQTAFGGGRDRRRLARWLTRRSAGLCAQGGYLVIAGANDTVARLGDLPTCLSKSALVLPGATHRSVLHDERTWAAVLPWMRTALARQEGRTNG